MGAAAGVLYAGGLRRVPGVVGSVPIGGAAMAATDVLMARLASATPGSTAPTIWLQDTGGSERGKNRFHPDLVTTEDPDAEVARLLALGARRTDVGQTGTERFIVLADPEDNEFCVLRGDPRRRIPMSEIT
ncbi:VOC family protein [Cryptosporangium sp. NPDC051539]|uniref:VOC family protein n=1 Tax=Cryptosporangium sp. NPDC051539 TaxID=3363962 RepID=UPI00379ADE41